MNESLTIACDIHFERRGRGSRRELEVGAAPAMPIPGRVPRVARLLALAIRFEQLLRDGEINSQTELAQLGHVSRARVSQIMNLLNLAPDLQEALLNLPRTVNGRDLIHLRQLQLIASTLDWRKQRRQWETIAGLLPPQPNAAQADASNGKTERSTDLAGAKAI